MCGVTIRRAEDNLSSGLLDGAQAQLLQLDAGHPCVVLQRRAFDLQGRCVELRTTRAMPTLMLDASSFAGNPALFAKLPYDTVKAFRPIGVIALFPNVVLVNGQFPVKSVADLITAAKVRKVVVAFRQTVCRSADDH